MASCPSLLARLSAFAALSPVETTALQAMLGPRRRVRARADLLHEHDSAVCAFVVHEGWAASYKLLPGGERQIVDFHVPGEVAGLRALLLGRADHNVQAVTEVAVSDVTAAALARAFEAAPRLGLALLGLASRSEAALAEHLVDVGRRSADERTAHLLLELALRLGVLRRVASGAFACPLSQYAMADALGLTADHLNRVLRRLREAGLVTVRRRAVILHDLPRLFALTGFDPTYLGEMPAGAASVTRPRP